MAIQVSNNPIITFDPGSTTAAPSVTAIDLTDHCVQLMFNDGQSVKDATTLTDSRRKFRPSLGEPAVELTFFNDMTTSSVEETLRGCTALPNYRSANSTSTGGPTVPSAIWPIAPTVALAGLGAGNLLNGTYKYGTTFVYWSFESAASTTLTSIAVASSSGNGQVAGTAVPTGPVGLVVARNIYRTQLANGTSSAMVLLTTIADNTTTTFTDNASSSSLVGNASMPFQPIVTGVTLAFRKSSAAQGAANPQYSLAAILDGALSSLDEKPGELPQIKAKFVPVGSLTVSTTS